MKSEKSIFWNIVLFTNHEPKARYTAFCQVKQFLWPIWPKVLAHILAYHLFVLYE